MEDTKEQRMLTQDVLDRRQAASYLTDRGYPVAYATLAAWAVQGRGPQFARMGRKPLYRRDELDRWAAAQVEFQANSTSAHDAARRNGA
jgi:hypothetical protein